MEPAPTLHDIIDQNGGELMECDSVNDVVSFAGPEKHTHLQSFHWILPHEVHDNYR